MYTCITAADRRDPVPDGGGLRLPHPLRDPDAAQGDALDVLLPSLAT